MISKKYTVLCLILIATATAWIGCNPTNKKELTAKKRPIIQRNQPPAFTYGFVKTADWLQQQADTANINSMNIITAVNRTDVANLKSLDSILIPSALSGDVAYYTHFPLQLPLLNEIDKIIFFNYTTQTFAAYEFGELMYAGPTNMGRKADPTPVGLYFCNWKAGKTISTFNDEWELKWNVNIENKEGIGFHQYALPGYPVSHSCLRLREADAKLLYNWVDQWTLNSEEAVEFKGTPVIVFGSYPFDGPKPWLALRNNSAALDISATVLQEVLQPHLSAVRDALRNRNIDQLDSAN
jgi:lipoprotein-anchoring transpeptidase ErfK/SrfK